jgi:hypothetical protein
MFEIGLIFGNDRKPVLPLEDVQSIIAELDVKQLFDVAWRSYIPGEIELYAYINLCTGELHGGDVLQLNLKDVYLILFKMEVEPHHVLTDAELHDYLSEHNGNPLHKWCQARGIQIHDRLEAIGIETFEYTSWYWNSVINESLIDFYAKRKPSETCRGGEVNATVFERL